MYSNRIRISLIFFSVLSLLPAYLWAGGPNVLDKGGEVYRWDRSRPVPYSIDLGTLGILSEEESLLFVREAFGMWTDIPGAVIEFEEGDRLEVDVNGSNYREFFGFGQVEPKMRPENPVIFDENGEIIDDYLGQGASDSVAGFAGIRFMDSEEKEFQSSWVVINAKILVDLSILESFNQIMPHELGHMIGLDHSQGLPENYNDSLWGPYSPVMYPYASYYPPKKPTHDDITWLSWLYPSPGFAGQVETGTIRGKVKRPTGDPLLGANVIARKVIDGELSRSEFTSVASGFLMLEQGEFEFPGLTPGDYAVCIEPINSAFTGGSGIGPYDQRPTNFPRDYFDADESADEDPNLMKVITVSAGDTIDGLVLISNEYTRELASLGDDDEVLYSFPEGFSFPFYGKAYRSVYVSSDGILSFRIGDHPDGSLRTESRFLSGPARIAPLYSDLNPGDDPAEVRVESGEDGNSLTFYWYQVPEFSFPAPLESNTFSVTLFRNGDIRISYGDINLTPDFSRQYEEGLSAIVGVTPGGVESGESTDLSADSFYFAENNGPVYEVFPGDSLDLDHSTIEFNASQAQLFFPLVRSGDQEFTGVALTNFGPDSAVLDFEARDRSGVLTPGQESNPSQFQIESGNQLGKLSREIFNPNPGGLEAINQSWIRLLSNSPEIGSFTQIGNGIEVRQTSMDGAIAFTEPSTQLVFTRLYQGEAAYPVQAGTAWAPASTNLYLANPDDNPVGITLGLYSQDGLPAASEVSLTIDPLGYYSSDLAGLFNDAAENISSGYVKVEAAGRGVVGFEFIELEDTYIGLNASFPSTERILYSAQLAHHETIFTSLKIVNPTKREIGFTLKAYLVSESAGIEEKVSLPVTLFPNQSFQENVSEIFGLPENPDLILVGSIQLTATGLGLVGDVVFGDPVNALYAASLPLRGRLFTRAIQSHISNGRFPGDPSRDAFTGLAVFNPGILESTVFVSAFDRNGFPVGETTQVLDPGGRFSLTLLELIPETEGMSGGFVEIESNNPIVAQQLFGNTVLDYMSAIPPTIIE
jgi:hypothetical protein